MEKRNTLDGGERFTDVSLRINGSLIEKPVMGKLRRSLLGRRHKPVSQYNLGSTHDNSILERDCADQNFSFINSTFNSTVSFKRQCMEQTQPSFSSRFLLYQNGFLESPRAPPSSFICRNLEPKPFLKTFNNVTIQEVLKENNKGQDHNSSVTPGSSVTKCLSSIGSMSGKTKKTQNFSLDTSIFSMGSSQKKYSGKKRRSMLGKRFKSSSGLNFTSTLDNGGPSSDMCTFDNVMSTKKLCLGLNQPPKDCSSFIPKKLIINENDEFFETPKNPPVHSSCRKRLSIVGHNKLQTNEVKDLNMSITHAAACGSKKQGTNNLTNQSEINSSLSPNLLDTHNSSDDSLKSFVENETTLLELENQKNIVTSSCNKRLSKIDEESWDNYHSYNKTKRNEDSNNNNDVEANLVAPNPIKNSYFDEKSIVFLNTMINTLQQQKIKMDNAFQICLREKMKYDAQFDGFIDYLNICSGATHNSDGNSNLVTSTIENSVKIVTAQTKSSKFVRTTCNVTFSPELLSAGVSIQNPAARVHTNLGPGRTILKPPVCSVSNTKNNVYTPRSLSKRVNQQMKDIFKS